jgi:CRISPR-associated protein Cmr6
MLSRRKNLQVLEYSDHAGLTLQKLLKEHDEKGELTRALLNAISEIKGSSEAYKTAFMRWQNHLPNTTIKFAATTNSALAIGLGDASPLEVGLTIHHTYGTPYLPGSAIKGLLIRAADAHGLSAEAKAILFGTPENAAHLIYWDAMLEPSSTQLFQQDVITVHHPKYYGSSGKPDKDGKEIYPTDFDDPTPVAFLSVRPNTKFFIAISSNSEGAGEWLELAAELLKYALENMGLGGKTNAGYGYFEEIKLPEKVKSEADQGLELLEQKRAIILQIKAAQDLSKVDVLTKELERVKPEIRRKTLDFLQERLKSIKQWNLEKPRCQKILAMLEGTV